MTKRFVYARSAIRGVSAGILLATVFLLAACGVQTHSAAGIIAFSRIHGETYVLLADHLDSDRGWGTFGGNRDHGESVALTASREFREETRCVYTVPSESDLAGEPTVGNRRFLSYVIEVPFVPAEEFINRPVPEDCRGPEYNERGPWVWILLEELIQVLENPDSDGEFKLKESSLPAGSRTTFWAASARIVEKALDKGLLK